MDFIKVLDQTVRDIKREVNLKVLKVPEIEQKVLDATSDEPWGPHGSALSELAHASKKFTECQMIMNALWTRLGDMSANWRHIYKALSVIEYLIANGSERAIDNILEQSHKISSLAGFEYVEPNGKDVGVNVRKKVETILAILGDKEKIQSVRVKADATRDKYFGLSSTGITYKANSATNSGIRDVEFFKDSFKDEKQSHRREDGYTKPRKGFSHEKEDSRLKKGMLHNSSNPKVSATSLPKPGLTLSSSPKTKTVINFDEFDDFDPRGSSTKIESSIINSPQVNLFGENFVGGLLDATTSPQVVDLLAHTQGNLNLFADQTVNPDLVSEAKSLNPTNVSNFDPFYSAFSSESNVTSTNATHSSTFDPFAAFPLSNADGSDDLFGSFTSNTSAPKDLSVKNLSNLDQPSLTTVSPATKKDHFQVKSGIWADSLSRGLIDLNITAPKKTNLAGIGIAGGLSDEFNEKERAQPSSLAYPGRPIGAGMKTFI